MKAITTALGTDAKFVCSRNELQHPWFLQREQVRSDRLQSALCGLPAVCATHGENLALLLESRA